MADERLQVSDEEDVSLPMVDILTGRGFVTGKSGSGKSNTVNVLVEEILDRNQPLLIVDTDGEYWGLKEQYSILHLGNGDQCDVRVTSTDAETIVDLALVEHVPIILDISGFLHSEDAQEIVHRVIRELFHREKTLKEPFLLIVEEVHEYIPETGGLSDMGEMLIQVAKRGRKHGLGFLGVSQRPASVDKDFITQCDWIVWHRLTWKNDTDVVSTILGNDAADTVEDLNPGEALLMADWNDQTTQVQMRKKATYDAGATPGFEEWDPPELIPVNPAWLKRFDERRRNVDYGDADEAAEADAEPLEEEEPTEFEAEEATDGDDADEESQPAETVAIEEEAEGDQQTELDEATETSGEALDASEAETESAGEMEPAAPSPEAPPEVSGDDPPAPTVENGEAARQPAVKEAEVVHHRSRNAPGKSNRDRGPNGPSGGQTAPPSSSEGAVLEFAQMLFYLAGRVRTRIGKGLAAIQARLAAGVAAVRTGTALEDDDVVVAGWLAIVLLFIVLLAVALVVVT
ncbi:ATP-binding protein [Halobacteriales archaeon Cl-PHB]